MARTASKNAYFRQLVAPIAAAGVIAGAAGCSQRNDAFVEDGPAALQPAWESDTGRDVAERVQPAPTRHRSFPSHTVTTARGIVTHDPLYFENPFVEAGTMRDSAGVHHQTPVNRNLHRIGWEDPVAMAYSLPRFGLNLAGLPVSLVFTRPWELMESDGFVQSGCIRAPFDAVKTPESDRGRGMNDFELQVLASDGATSVDPHSSSAAPPEPAPAPSSAPAESAGQMQPL